MEAIKNIEKAVGQFKQAKESLVADLKGQFEKVWEELFTACPNLMRFTWNQATPGFNDGDPCYFSVHTPSVHIKIGEDEWEDAEPSDYASGTWQKQIIKKDPSLEAVEQMSSLIQGQAEELMEDVYGNDQTITISRQEDGTIKVETDDYYE